MRPCVEGLQGQTVSSVAPDRTTLSRDVPNPKSTVFARAALEEQRKELLGMMREAVRERQKLQIDLFQVCKIQKNKGDESVFN